MKVNYYLKLLPEHQKLDNPGPCFLKAADEKGAIAEAKLLLGITGEMSEDDFSKKGGMSIVECGDVLRRIYPLPKEQTVKLRFDPEDGRDRTKRAAFYGWIRENKGALKIRGEIVAITFTL